MDLPMYSHSAYCASLCERERKNPGRQWPLRMGDLLLNPGDTQVLCVHTRSGKRWQVSLQLRWVLRCTELALNALPWQQASLLMSWRGNLQILKANKIEQFNGNFVPVLHSLLLCSLLPLVGLWNWPVILFLAYYFWFFGSGWCFYMTNAVHGFSVWHHNSDMFA